MNIAMISGRLVRDIELKYTNAQEPMAFCKFTLAVDRGMSKVKKEQAQQNGQAVADFINVTVFGKQAENCSKFLAKGRMVAIQGSLQSGSYTAQDGTKRYTTEVMAQRVEFIDWGNSKQNNQANQNTQPFGHFEDDFGFTETNEDIPF
ncbi:hypothetical protein HMPREF3188_00673 [Tissierellia bacterium KA00581]|nr:hypothetical protein HMPREF3188_00673 [Tissierellia bacterium KA00581]